MGRLTGESILVTGGTGFVGSHLIEALVAQNITPVVLIRSAHPKSYYATKRLDKKSITVYGDIRNQSLLTEVIIRYGVSYIFHLAAQAIVPTAYIDPYTTIETNIIGTLNVLEACRIVGTTKGIIIASSDKAYGELNKKKYIESDALKGVHPYDASKSAADILSQSYSKTYNMPVVVTRFGNIYGEGDLNFSRIIPGIIQSLIHNKQLAIRSDGNLVRDYVYVKDVVNGYLSLAEHIEKLKGEAFNFSSNESLSVLNVIKTIEKELKLKVSYKITNSAKQEIPYQSLDDAKARRSVGYKNGYTIRSTITNILKWYTSILE